MIRMKKPLAWLLAIVMLAAAIGAPAPSMASSDGGTPATIFGYAPSERYAASVNYTLKANGVTIPVIQAYADYDYAHFSASEGPITYELTILNTDKVHEYAISPKKLGLTASKVEGRTITFTTESDEYLIVMMNNRKTRIVIAADPMETDVPASTGTGVFNIAEEPYSVTPAGGNADVAARTSAIQQAIDEASQYGTEQGGGAQGIVYVPRGTYYIGNLVLRSNTALYMEPGATFVGTGRTADYQEHWFKDSMGRPATWWISTEFDSANIRIFGRGTIDGNGRLLHDDKSANGRGMINNLVVPIATEHFAMDGIIIRESAAWAVMPVRSNDLLFTNLKMFNSLGMGENDGIDIVESQNAVVRNSIGIALDDPYSTKAWKEDTDIASGVVPWPGNPEPVDSVLFEDAISWTMCYGYKIGQGVMQNQSDITFRDAVVYKAAVGFAIHHKYGTGEVRDVTFENIDVEDISGKNEDNSAWMTMFTVDSGGNGVGPVTGVTVKDITVRDVGESFSKLKGAPGAPITDLTFENVRMPGSSQPATTLHAMNFLSKEYYGGVTILPTQEPEPRKWTNLALLRPAVISSNDAAENTAPYAFDGKLTTRSGTKRAVDPGWIYVDLGEVKTIDRVHLIWEAAYGRSYQIQVTDEDPGPAGDQAEWSDVYSTTTGKGGLEEITFAPTEARYVRMYGTARATQYGYSLWEMEVYGPEIFVDSIGLSGDEHVLELGEAVAIEAVVLPDNATNKAVIWSSTNPGIASVDGSGLVTAAGTGTAYITATSQSGERSATAKITVTAPGAGMTFIEPTHAAIQYVGRWDAATSDTYMSHWPGASIRAGFTGTKARLVLGGAADLFVKIDDGAYTFYDNASGTINLTRTPLEDGTHELTIVAKDITDRVAFQGLLVEEGKTVLPAEPKERLVEFVGDSITVGYRMPDVVLDSYARLTAERLGVDHTQIAYTGICLQTGVACYAPNSLGMSEQYFKLGTGDDAASPEWDFARYAPDAIVINIGTNDDKFEVTEEAFRSTYATFLADIRERHPNADILVMRTLGGFLAEATEAAVQERIEAGDDAVQYVDTTGWLDSYPSADYYDSLHPSRAGHAKIAAKLAPILEELWQEDPGTGPGQPGEPGPGPGAGPGNGVNTGSGNSPKDAVIYVNGKAATTGKLETRIEEGRRTTTVKLDGEALNGKLSGQAFISITVPAVEEGAPDTVIGEIGSKLLANLIKNNAVLELATGEASYALPLGALVQSAFNEGDGQLPPTVRIVIAKPTEPQLLLAREAEDRHGFRIAGGPMSFHVEVVQDGKTTLVETFGVFVARRIALPDGADPDRVFAGAVLEPDGSIRYVPAKSVSKNGRDYIELASLSNSLYVIVQGGADSFPDVVGHWSEDSVTAMAARFVAEGTDEGLFRPDRDIRRSEFAALVVRALGLKRIAGNGEFEFHDVIAGAWYEADVVTAASYGLIGGFGDGTFRPSDAITREQAMSILAKAAELTGLKQAQSDEAVDDLLGAFLDGGDVSEWAQPGVAFSLEEGIAKGRSESRLAPRDPVTRAEAFVMLERLLEKSGLIES
ncbi:S-layer homology domain-containing protein [Paenibacillus soyae]|uniref:S-layer homology domain-containing protein n=1 Tax=Paenibacillus soyae TaxID=2969249 RepID=A0A9X2MYP3_9BACL|nr:S-layer homology domain-containing protein [Paenibacillus soyae]MCR2805932.1 S-layer homology domain-containing protein [Paenibacillus soyae]